MFTQAFTTSFFPAQILDLIINFTHAVRATDEACARRRARCTSDEDDALSILRGAGASTLILANSIKAAQPITLLDQATSSRASTEARTKYGKSFSCSKTPKLSPPCNRRLDVFAADPPSSQTSFHSDATLASSSFCPRNAIGKTRRHHTSLLPPSLNCDVERQASARSAAAAARRAAGSSLLPVAPLYRSHARRANARTLGPGESAARFPRA
mmetsp:Transcript_20041/g.30957  ORF Transcript_20041/g.30957 Transcript_20041/m.30957 type:complete len:213 (+) Transcript_20041:966-1604(+)